MANVNNGAATDAATASTTAPEAAPEAAPETAKPTEVVATLFTRFVKPHYISGTFNDSKGKLRRYEYIATQVAVDTRVHDALFDEDAWDEIAGASAPSATVRVRGVLRHRKNKTYIVNQGTPDEYERLTFTGGVLEDIEETRGSALAFKRGVRRDSFAALKAKYTADADIEADFDEPKADLG